MKHILPLLLLISFGADFAYAAEKQIDGNRSSLTIHVGKSGLFAAAGHEHTVTAPVAEGIIDDGSNARVRFKVETNRLAVMPEEHQSEIQHTMQEKVLEAARYPEIVFHSDSIQAAGKDTWMVSGTLMLHGQAKPLHITVQRTAGQYVGTTTIRQTDFGIQPVSAAGGAVKVKDDLRIDFSLRTK